MVDDKNNFAVINLLTKLMDIAIGGLLQGFAGCQGNNCPRFTRSIDGLFNYLSDGPKILWSIW